ncbi:hypothetical protein AMECASPLE_019295 [Ameca splendens]|uniref:Uncharacterized protein n=1 Tax=Ameca splendens TaxID=208324 RepID=A0ABV0Y2T6_9TELE
MAYDDASPAEDVPDTVMPRGAPCMCGKKCRGRSGTAVFLGLFLLSLTLHAVTLVCYLDLRSEVKREITHQKRDSMVTPAGVDLADPVGVLPPGHPRVDTSHSEEDRELIRNEPVLKCSFGVFEAPKLRLQTGLAAKLTRRVDWDFPTNHCLILAQHSGISRYLLSVAAETEYKTFSRNIWSGCVSINHSNSRSSIGAGFPGPRKVRHGWQLIRDVDVNYTLSQLGGVLHDSAHRSLRGRH